MFYILSNNLFWIQCVDNILQNVSKIWTMRLYIYIYIYNIANMTSFILRKWRESFIIQFSNWNENSETFDPI